ncbi:MAG: MFS transporter [Rhizobiaceae bacterium]
MTQAISHYDSRYSWFRLGISVLAATIGSVGTWAVIVTLPAVQAEFGLERGDASLAYTATMVGFGAGNLLIGRFIDRYGITPAVMLASLALALGFAGSAMTNSFMVFCLLHGVFLGTGAAAVFGPLIADVSHWFLKSRGVAVATAACGNYFAGAIWPLVLKGPVAEYGWRPVFLSVAVACLVLMIPLALLLKRQPPRGEGNAKVAAVPLKPSSLTPSQLQAMLILAGFACCMAMSMPQVHIVAYCADLGFGAAAGAEMLSLMLAGGVVSRLVSGYAADRIGGVMTLIFGSLMQCLALLLFIPFDGLVSLYAVSLIFGLSQGGIVPCYAIIVREYLPSMEAGRRIGLVILATTLGMAVGGWMTGWIYDMTGSYAQAFLNGIAWNLVNLAAMAMVLRRTRQIRLA